MLNELIEKDLVAFYQEAPSSWQDAIKLSCAKLIEHEYITEEYSNEIIASVEKFGPYIVIIPDVAMPHANPSSPGVLGTAIAMTKFKEDIKFFDQENNEEKNAKLFFTLAAKDSDHHLNNITQLMELLSDEDLLEKLKDVNSIDELKVIL
ncbi:PTS sugar transporter subunit IIA [Eremococcus coleocola]|uniref:PTS sugar transporter subunit IIA n=1 Tax=Eremococcus coleocola TaxID=88132 RepID=UPI0004269219|nr:PTS sugar transporter subunit IIA [Eremococcus coleocola]